MINQDMFRHYLLLVIIKASIHKVKKQYAFCLSQFRVPKTTAYSYTLMPICRSVAIDADGFLCPKFVLQILLLSLNI